MALLRMLAFTPSDQTQNKAAQSSLINVPTIPSASSAKDVLAGLKSATTHQSALQSTTSIQPLVVNSAPSAVTDTLKQSDMTVHTFNSLPQPAFDGDWRTLVESLKLGIAKSLAVHCELVKFDENNLHFTLTESDKHLMNNQYQEKLKLAISQYFGRKIALHISLTSAAEGVVTNSPIAQITQEKVTIQNNAEQSIQEDAFVQALIKDFGATIIPNSIKPLAN